MCIFAFHFKKEAEYMKALKAELVLLSVTAIWGGTFLCTKIGLDYTNFSFYILVRFSIALIITIAVFGKHIKNIDKKIFKGGLVLGALFGSGFVFQTLGLKFTEVSNSAFITGLTVPLTPIVTWFILKKNIPKWSIIGCIVGFIGLTIFTNPFGGNFNVGDALTLVSTFFWAFYINYMDVFTKDRSEMSFTGQMLFMQFITSFVICGLTFLIFDINQFYFRAELPLFLSLAYNAIIASFFVTLLHTHFQKYSTPVKAALIFSLEPLFATLFSLAFGMESLSTDKIIGGIILLFGVLVSELGPIVFNKKAMLS